MFVHIYTWGILGDVASSGKLLMAGVEEEVKRAIMSKTELEEIWTKHTSKSSPPEPVPDIDFETVSSLVRKPSDKFHSAR